MCHHYPQSLKAVSQARLHVLNMWMCMCVRFTCTSQPAGMRYPPITVGSLVQRPSPDADTGHMRMLSFTTCDPDDMI